MKPVTPQIMEVESPTTAAADIAIYKQVSGEVERRLSAIGISVSECFEVVNMNERADERLHTLVTQSGNHRVGWWRIFREHNGTAWKTIGICGVAAERYWE